jgi:hypothetical protein
MQHNDINLQCGPHHILHTSNVPLRHKFLGRRSLLVAVPASHAPPALPPHPISDRRLGAKRGENYSVPNLVNMADGVTPLILNLESVSLCDGLYELGVVMLQTRQKTNYVILFELLA